jgi:hypothetical protein
MLILASEEKTLSVLRLTPAKKVVVVLLVPACRLAVEEKTHLVLRLLLHR